MSTKKSEPLAPAVRPLHNRSAMPDLTSDANVSYVVAATATVIGLLVFTFWTLLYRLRAANAEVELQRGLVTHLGSDLDWTRTELRRARETISAFPPLELERDLLQLELVKLRAHFADERERLKYERDEVLDVLEQNGGQH